MPPIDAGPMVALRLVIAVLAAAAGALVAVSFKKISHLGLCLLISFAAGALLAVTFFDIVPETFESVGWLGGTVSLASGYLLFFLLTRFVFHVCPACSATHTEVKFRAVTAAMVTALSVHSFMDGLAIYGGTLSGETTGLSVLLAVAVHKFPEGLALSLVAMGSGMGALSAFLLSFALEALTTVSGGVSGVLFPFSEHAEWVGYVMGHTGGGFLFIGWHALLSEFLKHHPKHTVLAALLGAALIGLVQYFHA